MAEDCGHRMLLVRTSLKQSAIHGIGLFAAEPLKKGTVIWKLQPPLDQFLNDEDLARLSEHAREMMFKYSYLDPVLKKRVLCGDDARFMNHSDSPNCDDLMDEEGGVTVTARDVAVGEELTCDYAKIDLNFVPYKR